MKDRDISIDILKCFAAIIITNSHMELLYGKYSMLATGGAIGDVLFFFCSGYTLFLGRNAGFFDWYKRRINRIYPTVFAIAVVATLFGWGNWQYRNILDVILFGGGWFVSCIMIYYVIFWLIRSFFVNHLKYVFACGIAAVFLWYFTIGIDANNNNMYGGCYFKWVHYFLYMLLGAIIGYKKSAAEEKPEHPSLAWTLLKLFVSVIMFYALCWFKCKNGIYDFVQMSSLIPLLGVTYYAYQLCNTKLLISIYNNVFVGPIIKLVGGLCLEIYLIQGHLFTDKMNFMFPINLFVMFFIIVIAAYMLRCFARVWSQTFKDGNYDWKAIVKI